MGGTVHLMMLRPLEGERMRRLSTGLGAADRRSRGVEWTVESVDAAHLKLELVASWAATHDCSTRKLAAKSPSTPPLLAASTVKGTQDARPHNVNTQRQR